MTRGARAWPTLSAACLIVLPAPALGEPGGGAAYEITETFEGAEDTSDGKSSNARGCAASVARVIAGRGNGVEIEHDLPATATSDARARAWHLPVRVLRSLDGSGRLLTRDALEARLARRLAVAG